MCRLPRLVYSIANARPSAAFRAQDPWGQAKKPGSAYRSRISMRVASPRQGDFAEPDRGFTGEGPAPRPPCRIAATSSGTGRSREGSHGAKVFLVGSDIAAVNWPGAA